MNEEGLFMPSVTGSPFRRQLTGWMVQRECVRLREASNGIHLESDRR